MTRHPASIARLLAVLLALGAITECFAQYAGPSLLSRGGNRPGRRGRATPKLNVYASTRGSYDSGLLTSSTENGEIKPLNTPGIIVEGGAYGGKDWRRASIGLDYRGDYRHLFASSANSSAASRLNGTNQVIAVDSTYRQSRRTLINMSLAGGTTNRAFGAFIAPSFGDTSRTGIPLNEVFDTRTYFTQAEAGFVHQRSARMSISADASAFFIKREGYSLINSQGYRAQGGLQYRINRRTTLLGNYQWLSFSYPRLLANSFIHGISAGFEHKLTRSWTIIAMGGAYLIHSTGTESVTLSDEVALILGRSTGQAYFSRSGTAPLVDASATYQFEKGSLRIHAASAMIPGNGAYLTSTRQTVNAGYSYAGTRRLSLGVNGGWNKMSSRSLDMEPLTGWQFGGGLTYRLVRYTQLMTQFDRRYWQTSAINGRTGYTVSIGLAWNPSRFPLAIF